MSTSRDMREERDARGGRLDIAAWVPATFVVLSLAALVAIPIWTEWRMESLRRELDEIVEPARERLDNVRVALGREVAAKRGYLLTRDTRFRSLYDEAAADVVRELAALAELADALSLAPPDELTALAETVRRWHVSNRLLLEAELDPDRFGRELVLGQAEYEAALAAAADVDAQLGGVARTRLTAIRDLDRRRDQAMVFLASAALASMVFVLWFGSRISALARELGRTADGERAARREAEAAVRAREEILAMVSHDLRSPVATVDMAATLLMDSELREDQTRQQLAVIKRTSSRMARLIEDLLDVSRLESGRRLPLDLREEPVQDLLREAAEAHLLLARRRGIHLTVEDVPTLPPLLADHDRILRVLGNLIDNAVKFTPEGGRVDVGARAVPGGICLYVNDSGPGLRPDELERIFEPFWQGAHTVGPRGAGLGLAIARGIVEAHGGTLEVESREGRGSTFSVTLPAAGSLALGGQPGPRLVTDGGSTVGGIDPETPPSRAGG